MKVFVPMMLAIMIVSCSQPQSAISPPRGYKLFLNPSLDTTKVSNLDIAEALENFLSTKNNNPLYNPLWEAGDFKKYPYPFYDIYQIEKGKSGPNTYLPTLLEILPTDTPHQHLVKIGFMGSPDSSGTYLRAIYNLLAIQNQGQITFKRILDYNTRSWPIYQKGSITYHISPNKIFNEKEASEQEAFVRKLCRFFELDPIKLQYYSCVNPAEIFQIRGFDYEPQMYSADKGGQNEVWSRIIYSGNNSEKYEHEVVHSYIYERFRLQHHPLFDEGLATYLGGSAQLPYPTHRQYVKEYLEIHPEFDLREHLDPYNAVKIREYTAIPYVIGALICEYAYRYQDKDSLLQLFQSGKTDDDLWVTLEGIGLNKENFNEQLRELLQEETVLIFN
jgi:hypothetical protein